MYRGNTERGVRGTCEMGFRGAPESLDYDAMTARRKIGLLGGTFNPVHLGHLILARDAREAQGLDEVWLMPAGQPVHKLDQSIAAATHRLAMVKAAVSDESGLNVCRVEVERQGATYTVDTLRILTAEYPAVDWTYIVGADTLPQLVTWREIEEVLTLSSFACMRRPGMPDDPGQLAAQIDLPAPWPERLVEGLFTGHRIEISSSEIRKRLASGQSIRYLVPESVETYIREHHLYLVGD